MSEDQMTIDTAAEVLENDVLPKRAEVHTDPDAAAVTSEGLPQAMNEPASRKSPAQWAYERIILYIKNFENQLDNDHEVGMGFAGNNAGTIRIEGLGYYDPDIITFYGTNQSGAKTQLVQHVSQLNVSLVASPKHIDQPEPKRIGFHLATALERAQDVTT